MQEKIQLKGEKVLITGANGFIGANLIKQLLKLKYEIHAVVRDSADLWRLEKFGPTGYLHTCNLHEFSEIESVISEVDPDYIYNFACPVFNSDLLDEYLIAMLDSQRMLLNLLQLCLSDRKIKAFIHAGSSLEYQPSLKPLTEQDRIEPYTLRGIIKSTESQLCHFFANTHHVPVIIARIFRAYGPMEQANRLIIQSVQKFYTGNHISLVPKFVKKDFIYIDDLVEGLILLIQKEIQPGTVFNFGSGTQHTVHDIVSLIGDILGGEIKIGEIKFKLKDSDIISNVCNNQKAATMLGWSPRTPILEGLIATVNWCRNVYNFENLK